MSCETPTRCCEKEMPFSSACNAKISCAIDLLCDLENLIRCHSANAPLTPDEVETAERFFRQLIAAQGCIVMKASNGTPVTDINAVKDPDTQLSTYGCRTFNKALCKVVEHDFWTIELQATCQPSGDPFPFFLNYLTILVPPNTFGPSIGPANKGPVYIATDSGFSNTINPPPSLDSDDTYIVIDRDELLVGLCQLKNHLLEKLR